MLALCSVALGKETDEPVARRHFEEGTKHYRLGEFKDAVERYKLAYKIKPDPVFLYNIAQAYRLADDFANALFFYRSYLNGAPHAPNRAEVEERIQKLESQIAQRRAIPSTPLNEPAAPSGAPLPVGRAVEATVVPVQPAPHATAAAAPVRPRRPIYKSWWLWTTAAVVVGVSVGVGLGVGLSGAQSPQSHFGTIQF